MPKGHTRVKLLNNKCWMMNFKIRPFFHKILMLYYMRSNKKFFGKIPDILFLLCLKWLTSIRSLLTLYGDFFWKILTPARHIFRYFSLSCEKSNYCDESLTLKWLTEKTRGFDWSNRKKVLLWPLTGLNFPRSARKRSRREK